MVLVDYTVEPTHENTDNYTDVFFTKRERELLVSQEVISFYKELMLSKADYQEIMNIVTDECDKGLASSSAKDSKGLPMLCSYVTSLPTGEEVGQFLTLDFGGTNFRVVLAKLGVGGRHRSSELREISHRVPDNIKVSDCDTLFSYMAETTKDAMLTWGLDPKKRIYLCLTFSFPCKHISLRDAIVLNLGKEFVVKDIVGKNVADCLQKALDKNGLNVQCVATVNDTVSTLTACRFEDPRCCIGVVVGTGTNAAYVERVSRTNFDLDAKHVVINTEWAQVGDSGSLDKFKTEYDRQLAKMTKNPGRATLEKLTSGLYLGELCRLAIVRLVKAGVLFNGVCPKQLLEPYSLPASYLSDVSHDPPGMYYNTEKLLLNEFKIKSATHMDKRIVRGLSEAVVSRSAGIIGAAIASLLKRIGDKSGVTIGVDGSLFKLHPSFTRLLTRHIASLLPDFKFQIALSENGSGKGVAAIGAAYCHKNIGSIASGSNVTAARDWKGIGEKENGEKKEKVVEKN